jgi:CxxC motif-containing protein (DUF1111 family)
MEKILLAILVTLSITISCKKILPGTPEDFETLDGPIAGMSKEENARFLEGDAAFSQVFTKETGLGPLFNSNSCVSCHAGDGKGHPSTTLTRFGQIDESGNSFLNQGGPQLQHLAIPGFSPEFIPGGATYAKFTPPANTGLGYLEYVTDAEIISLSDPNDANGDGISGVPNWIIPPSYVTLRQGAIEQNGKYICRFGKKAGAYDLLNQTVNAYNQDIGITTSFNPKDTYTGENVQPDISEQVVHNLVFYLRTLKAPVQRDQNDSEVQNGKQIFNQIQCAGCHKPTLHTGYSPISVLSYKEFYPYTDLLLHDMGAGLDDGYTEGSAKTYEWRTPPLWGLGLSESSQGGQFFLMHDGRAKSINEAILMHGGEGSNSRNLYQNLNSSDKSALMKFLMSL